VGYALISACRERCDASDVHVVGLSSTRVVHHWFTWRLLTGRPVVFRFQVRLPVVRLGFPSSVGCLVGHLPGPGLHHSLGCLPSVSSSVMGFQNRKPGNNRLSELVTVSCSCHLPTAPSLALTACLVLVPCRLSPISNQHKCCPVPCPSVKFFSCLGFVHLPPACQPSFRRHLLTFPVGSSLSGNQP